VGVGVGVGEGEGVGVSKPRFGSVIGQNRTENRTVRFLDVQTVRFSVFRFSVFGYFFGSVIFRFGSVNVRK